MVGGKEKSFTELAMGFDLFSFNFNMKLNLINYNSNYITIRQL